jgi:hypothetical protein
MHSVGGARKHMEKDCVTYDAEQGYLRPIVRRSVDTLYPIGHVSPGGVFWILVLLLRPLEQIFPQKYDKSICNEM